MLKIELLVPATVVIIYVIWFSSGVIKKRLLARTLPENFISERNYRLAQWAAGLLGLKDEAIYPDEMGDAEEYCSDALFDRDPWNFDFENYRGKPISDEEVLRKLVEDLAAVGITEEDILAKMKSLLKEVRRPWWWIAF